MVQRATGPRLLRDRLRPAGLEPRPRDRQSSTLTTRLSRHPTPKIFGGIKRSVFIAKVTAECACESIPTRSPAVPVIADRTALSGIANLISCTAC